MTQFLLGGFRGTLGSTCFWTPREFRNACLLMRGLLWRRRNFRDTRVSLGCGTTRGSRNTAVFSCFRTNRRRRFLVLRDHPQVLPNDPNPLLPRRTIPTRYYRNPPPVRALTQTRLTGL